MAPAETRLHPTRLPPVSPRDFWLSCGYRFLGVDAARRLQVTDDFLRTFLLRPALAPVADSCDDELRLHDELLADPRRNVPARAVDALADPGVRNNFRIWLRFRDRLLATDTLEDAWCGLFRGDGVEVSPYFLQQLTQVLCRHVLGPEADPLEARMAEFLFRAQRIARPDDGRILAMDDDNAGSPAPGAGDGSPATRRPAGPDILGPRNADAYWGRDERFDTAVCLSPGEPAGDALCRFLERWIEHFQAVEVRIRPVQAFDDRQWVWHVGLDAQASAILNDLFNKVQVEAARERRLLARFRLDFADPAAMRPALRGGPVYLGLAMDAEGRVRMKPQNLLLNLPLASPR